MYETWEQAPNYPYQVSDMGRVKRTKEGRDEMERISLYSRFT